MRLGGVDGRRRGGGVGAPQILSDSYGPRPRSSSFHMSIPSTEHSPAHRDATDLAKGALLSYLGMAARVSRLLFLAVASRWYGPSALGNYLLAWAVVEMVSKLALGGIDRSLLWSIPRYNHGRTSDTTPVVRGILGFHLTLALALSVLGAGLVLASSGWIAAYVFRDATLGPVLRLLGLALPSLVLTQTLVAATRALRTMRHDFLIRQCLEPLVLLGATLAILPFGNGPVGLAAAHLVASLTAVAAAIAAAGSAYRHLGWTPGAVGFSLDRSVRRELLSYLSPFALLTLFQALAAKIDLLLVGIVAGAAPAGLYGIAVELTSVVKRGGQNFSPMFQPIAAELFYSRQRERLRRSYMLVTRWVVAATLLPLLALTLYSSQLLGLFAIGGASMSSVLVILALAHAVSSSFVAADSLLLMSGRSRLSTTLAGVMLVITAGVSVALLPVMGAAGAALGVLAAQLCLTAARLVLVQKLHGLPPFGRELLWPLVTATATGVVFSGFNRLLRVETLPATVGVITLLVLCYAGLYWIGASEPEERNIMKKLVRRVRGLSPVESA